MFTRKLLELILDINTPHITKYSTSFTTRKQLRLIPRLLAFSTTSALRRSVSFLRNIGRTAYIQKYYGDFGFVKKIKKIMIWKNPMIIKHLDKTPQIDPSAYIAPTATVCGDVKIGKKSCILFGTSIIAEGGRIEIGDNCIILENAVIRSSDKHSTS